LQEAWEQENFKKVGNLIMLKVNSNSSTSFSSNRKLKKLKQEISLTSSSLEKSSGLLFPSSSSGMTTQSSSSSEVSFKTVDGGIIENLTIFLVSNLTTSIQRIIIKDNEDDNYYKKNILKTIIHIIEIYAYFYNYLMLLDIDYLKEYWKNEEARISKSIIAEESFYLIEQLSAVFTRTMEQLSDEKIYLVSDIAISIQCDEVGGDNEILSKCMFFLYQSSMFLEIGIPKRFVNIISCFYNLTNITDKFQLEFDKEMNNKEVFINYPFNYIEEESVLFFK